MVLAESKEQRGENSDFLFLGWTVRADIFGLIFFGSQKNFASSIGTKAHNLQTKYISSLKVLTKKTYKLTTILSTISGIYSTNLLKLNSCTYPFWFSSLFLPRRTRAHVRCMRARRANVRKNEDNYSRLLLLISF